MINRDEYSQLIAELVAAKSEIKRLQTENQKLQEQSKTDKIIKLLKAAGSGDAKKINKEIAGKVGCSLQHIYYCKREMRRLT